MLMRIAPARRINGRFRVPGDKSISHRAAFVAALAHGESVLYNFSDSDDCQATLNCLAALGVKIEKAGRQVRITGRGLYRLRPPLAALNCANSGSTMRMLAGVLAGQDLSATLTGDASLRRRPMGRIVEPLELMGARIISDNGLPPLVIQGDKHLQATEYQLPIASAQLKSCLLFAGLQAEGRTTVAEPAKTRDHTERMLQWFGVPLTITDLVITVDGPAHFDACSVEIPGDFSSAIYFAAAAALLPHSDLAIDNVGMNPTRTGALRLLEELGVGVEASNVRQQSNEPRGTVVIKPPEFKLPQHLRISGDMVGQIIDELPLLAVVGSQFGGIEIRDATELRVKETDRIRATVINLRAMGATVAEYEDGMRVDGPVRLKGAQLDSFGDHRIAMAFAVAALIAEGETEIAGSECVAVSFPGFFETLESIVER